MGAVAEVADALPALDVGRKVQDGLGGAQPDGNHGVRLAGKGFEGEGHVGAAVALGDDGGVEVQHALVVFDGSCMEKVQHHHAQGGVMALGFRHAGQGHHRQPLRLAHPARPHQFTDLTDIADGVRVVAVTRAAIPDGFLVEQQMLFRQAARHDCPQPSIPDG